MKRNETLRINNEEERLPLTTSIPAKKQTKNLTSKQLIVETFDGSNKNSSEDNNEPEERCHLIATPIQDKAAARYTPKQAKSNLQIATPTKRSSLASGLNAKAKKSKKKPYSRRRTKLTSPKKSRKQAKFLNNPQGKDLAPLSPSGNPLTSPRHLQRNISPRRSPSRDCSSNQIQVPVPVPLKRPRFLSETIGCNKKSAKNRNKLGLQNLREETDGSKQQELGSLDQYYDDGGRDEENSFLRRGSICSLYPEVVDASLLNTNNCGVGGGGGGVADTALAVCVNALGVGAGVGAGAGAGARVDNKSVLGSLLTPSKTFKFPATASCAQQLNKKLPEFIKRKRKPKTFTLNANRDLNRIASLRIRKPSPIAPPATKKPAEKKPPKQVQEKPIKESKTKTSTQKAAGKQQQQSKQEYPHLDPAIFNKIELLEEDIKPFGNNGSKRKRVYSATAALTFTTRKRSAVQRKNSNVTEKKEVVAPLPAADSKINESGNSKNNNNSHNNNNGINSSEPAPSNIEKTAVEETLTDVTSSRTLVVSPIKLPSESSQKQNKESSNQVKGGNMSMYDRRYQVGLATPSDDGVSNGYLNATRNSNSSSNSNTMHTVGSDQSSGADKETMQYYLPGGTANATSLGLTSSILSNGSGNGQQQAPLNHAPSMATLCNIGNSCYLNSVVYTLRFAPRFLHNLHHLVMDLGTLQQSIVRQRAKTASLGRGMSGAQLENAARSWSSKDLVSLEQYNSAMNNFSTPAAAASSASNCNASGLINETGSKSCHQLLTEKLHELYQSLHHNEISESTEPHHAGTLLNAIQDVCSIFEGNQQQDAHEFLMCMLNSIRETCQTLIKATLDYPDVILNGFATNSNDELDSYDKDNNPTMLAGGLSQTAAAVPPPTVTTTSSLSAKTSFFSRKSKRKDEAKNPKNFRLQSPLKDGGAAAAAAAPQTISNSLFYLNTVDLSGVSGGGGGTSGSSNASSAATVASCAAYKQDVLDSGCGSSIGNASSSSCSASLLKDKKHLAEKIRDLGLDFFKEDFEGITVATTKCLSCETVTEQKESMIDIAVPVPISGYDSSDYTEKPSAFIQNSCITREYFRGENKYRCEQCTGYTEAIRSISYEVLPRLLVIQLSRFSGGMEKINSYIPTSFTLQCFCAKCCQLSDADKLHIYKLYSVITHVGATMSVGHYIAYTCSLDVANEYLNCPKDRRNSAAQHYQQKQKSQQLNGLTHNSRENVVVTATQTSAASAAASALASSGTSLIKKMKFGRSKASSSGDMSKNVKHLNGLTAAAASGLPGSLAANAVNSKSITNGIGQLSMNATCNSLNCCATRLSSVQQQQLFNNSTDTGDESLQNGINHGNAASAGSTATSSSFNNYPAGYGSTGRGGTKSTPYAAAANNSEPIWYMCDDDKIKAMTQREFEELLSPARKITVTPYLLFYARFDTPASQSTPQSQQSTTSWSNESLQSGGGSSNPHKM